MGKLMHADSNTAAGMLLLTLLLTMSGCGALCKSERPWPAAAPQLVVLAEVPFLPQEQFQCGPAALAMVLRWSGITVSPEELAPQVYTPSQRGSLQTALIAGARRHGRLAYPISGTETLLAELAAGHPVIVLVNLSFFWYPKWHYAVAIGYDQSADEIILHSGRVKNERLSFRVFENLWARSQRWGLLVLPPSVLPVDAAEDNWLQATIGLERAGRNSAAATAYETALSRWPTSFGAWLGLGNSRYATSELAGAAAAFQEATRLQPTSGAAFNNLAQVLWEMGQRDEALTAARRAVSLGGPLLESFRQTLADIEGSDGHVQE
jgi:tetratricopeptide (TPR) repeat protein